MNRRSSTRSASAATRQPAPAARAASGQPTAPRKARQKPVVADDNEDEDDDGDDGAQAGKGSIPWKRRPELTQRCIEYLSDNVADRLKLFSDAVGDAKKEGRKKTVARDNKKVVYEAMAKYVFKDDAEEEAGYAASPARYTTSLTQHWARTRKAYQKHCKSLGETGAGLRPENVVPGSAMANSIDLIKSKFPFWDDLHGWWCELPNYNPVGISSSAPGTNHAASAAALFRKKGNQPPASSSDDDTSAGASDEADADGLDAASRAELDADPKANQDDTASGFDDGLSPQVPVMPLRSSSPASLSASFSRSPSVESDPAPAPRVVSHSSVVPPVSRPALPATLSSSSQGIGPGQKNTQARSASRAPATKKSTRSKNPIEAFSATRIAETERIGQKRKFEHDEFLAKTQAAEKVKRLKIESQERMAALQLEHEANEKRAEREFKLEMMRLQLQAPSAAAPRSVHQPVAGGATVAHGLDEYGLTPEEQNSLFSNMPNGFPFGP